jgi:hypothetical protein
MQSIGRWYESFMGKRTEIVRGGPIYIHTDQGIVTLIEEAKASRMGAPGGMRLEVLRPNAVHIVSARGVSSISIGATLRKRLLPALVVLPAILWTPLQYLWLSRRLSNEQKRKR